MRNNTMETITGGAPGGAFQGPFRFYTVFIYIVVMVFEFLFLTSGLCSRSCSGFGSGSCSCSRSRSRSGFVRGFCLWTVYESLELHLAGIEDFLSVY